MRGVREKNEGEKGEFERLVLQPDYLTSSQRQTIITMLHNGIV